MQVRVNNEFGKLKSIILGRPEGAVWPSGDIFFDRITSLSTYPTKIVKGKISEKIIDEARADMWYVKDVLEDHGVTVFRPEIVDWSEYTSDNGHTTTGMHTYSTRDLLLSIGDMVIECPTPYLSRQHEFKAYDEIRQQAIKDGCRWIAAPRPRMEDKECVINNSKIELTERYPIFDAANVMKFDDKLLYLQSSTGNLTGAKWLQSVVGSSYEVIVWNGVYSFAHIDSTISSIAPNTVLLNASRVTEENIPAFMKDYKKIWVKDVKERQFDTYPYASKWIGMNVLSIDPETIMIDTIQKDLQQQLKQEGFKIVESGLRHSRTLGGGHHCITCDLEREV